MTALERDSFFAYPQGKAHHAYADGETVIQLNSTSPWTVISVRGEDDPKTQ